MTHVIGVPPESTGADLLPTISTALALPVSETQLSGAVEVHFSYRLLHEGEPLSDEPIAAQGITEGTMLDLEIQVRATGPDGPFGEKVYRSAEDSLPGVPEKTIRAMVDTAFTHLLPWERHRDIAVENS